MTIKQDTIVECNLCSKKVVIPNGKPNSDWTEFRVKTEMSDNRVHLCYSCFSVLKDYFIVRLDKG